MANKAIVTSSLEDLDSDKEIFIWNWLNDENSLTLEKLKKKELKYKILKMSE